MASRNKGLCILALVLATAALAGCTRGPGPSQRREGDIVFWHTLRDDYAQLLQTIVDDFNSRSTSGKVELQFVGSYDDVFRKCSLAIKGGGLPTLATAYESMVTEYLASDVVVPLDDCLADPEAGLSTESRADIFPALLASNRYPNHGNRIYSFPFTKSVLMVYYNREIFEAVGCASFPQTWEDLIEACRAIRVKFDIPAYALSVDASTFDAMVLSCGGPLIAQDEKTTYFDAPQGVRAFEILRTMAQERLLKPTAYNSYDDRLDFVNRRAAFTIRSSAHRPFVQELVGDSFRWDMAMLPGAKGAPRRTVLFGGNVCMFRSAPDKERTAWEFLKHFTSREVTALWASRTGYLPVRSSAVEVPSIAAFFAENERNRRAFDALEFAASEPRAPGWQSVRRLIERAVTDVVEGKIEPAQAASELNAAAQAKLREVGAR
ncbi:MAG: ABC transporter substrate-binding protein [Planctomycetota bacterium]